MSGWSEPRTWAAGEVVTATLLNTELRDNLDFIAGAAMPRARVFRSTNQSTTSGTPVAITFDSERFDTAGIHSTSSLTSQLKVPAGADGLWLVGGCAEFENVNTTGNRILDVWVNGSTNPIARQKECSPASGQSTVLTVNVLWQAAADDFFELVVSQSSTTTLNILRNAAFSPEFWAYRVSA